MRFAIWLALLALPAGEASGWPACRTRPLPAATAAPLGLPADLHRDLEALLHDAVATGQAPAVSLVVVHRGRVFFRGQAGTARADTIYDLASLTKVVATVSGVMKLVELGRLSLSDPLARHLPGLPADKRSITVQQLLLHTSGLHSVVWRGKLTDGKEIILGRIRRSALKAAPGSAYRYSDIGFILLGELITAVSGMSLADYADRNLFAPLGMCDTGFRPTGRLLARVISPWPRGENVGLVYDPLAARLGGVAGHAGLFSTAEDLARFGQAMLEGGALAGQRILAPATVAQIVRAHPLPGGSGQRGLGWDISSSHAGGRELFSARSFGHTGYTGTTLWLDPERELVAVLLSNRTTREPAPSPVPLRRRLLHLLGGAIPPRSSPVVKSGLDVLVESGFTALRGQRIGLITNRTAVDRRGRWIGDVLRQAPGVQLLALFVPEHGLDARADRRINDSALGPRRGPGRRGLGGDRPREGPQRRIPVYSLFGARRRPTPETLAGLDALVFDLQTVGARYYTYLSTMGWAMEEAARHRLRFFVLDRPSPVGGVAVQGPLSTASRRTSTNYHPLPLRYGMTVGEVARYFDAERRIGARLTVIRAAGWQRAQLHPATGQPWVDPSPNIRSWRQALLYGGIGLLESTNLAVGRGTDSPFQLVGAPWIDGEVLARRLNGEHLAGVYFVATTFTPRAAPHRGEVCRGVRVLLLDPARINPPEVGIALAVALRALHRDEWETKNLYRLIAHPSTTAAILAGKGMKEILAGWSAGLERFARQRRRYLLY